MNPDQKFQQRWEYRRKDDEADSSSEDSKSNSVDESVQKKHKMVSNFILAQKDEESEKPRSQQNNQLDVSTGFHSQIVEGTKKRRASGKRKNAVQKKLQEPSGKKRNRKNHTQESALLSDLKIFTESLLEELKVASDKMLLQMKEQITKLATGKSALRTSRKKGSCLLKNDQAIHQNGNESGMEVQNFCSKLIERSMKGNEQVPQATGMENGEKLSLPEKKPINLANDSVQTVASPYFTLPTILSKQQFESLRTDFPSGDHMHPGSVMNMDDNVDANNHHGYLLAPKPDEHLGGLSRISSKNLGFFDQQGAQTSFVSGLPVQLHQWPNNCFNIPSQIVLENPGQGNREFGLRMNAGAIRFQGRSHALSDHFVTNTISTNTDNTNGGPISYRSQDSKGDHINPK